MRISRDQMFMEIARTASKRSTCHRLNVGAVLVKDNNVLSIGYNGPPSGEDHCQGNECKLSEKGSCTRAIHAEINALNRIALQEDREGITLYVTHSPCPNCALEIGKAGIETIIYETAYRDTSALDALTEKWGTPIYRLTPSGYLMNHRTLQVYNAKEQDQ